MLSVALPLADAIVAAWVVATLGALVFSILLLTSNVTWLTYGSMSPAPAGRLMVAGIPV